MGFAQLDTPPNAVSEQTDGKDYAGRPVAEVNVPPCGEAVASRYTFLMPRSLAREHDILRRRPPKLGVLI